MFKTVVWATDGSASADQALPYAKALAEGDDRHLIVVHGKEVFIGRGGGYPVLADEDELEAKIRHQVEQLREEGIDAHFALVKGPEAHAAHMIADTARDAGADVIVAGTRGHARSPACCWEASPSVCSTSHPAPFSPSRLPRAAVPLRTRRARSRLRGADHSIAAAARGRPQLTGSSGALTSTRHTDPCIDRLVQCQVAAQRRARASTAAVGLAHAGNGNHTDALPRALSERGTVEAPQEAGSIALHDCGRAACGPSP